MNEKDQAPTPQKAGGRCPICGKPTVEAVRPFCSKRCADIDLGRWLAGSYVISSESADADEDGQDRAQGEALGDHCKPGGSDSGSED